MAVANVLTTELRMYDDFRAKAHLYTNVLPQWDDVVSLLRGTLWAVTYRATKLVAKPVSRRQAHHWL